MNAALTYFKKVDSKLYAIANKFELKKLTTRKSFTYFQCLCREIVGQQLSGRLADVIFDRFLNLFANKKVSASIILKLEDEKLRNVGMAWSKVRAIKDMAAKVESKVVRLDKLSKMNNNEVVEHLTQVKGIGPWTAEMFLMFTLGREDVFSSRDLGLRNSMIKLYGLDEKIKNEDLEAISNRWSPFRSYACLALWNYRDGQK